MKKPSLYRQLISIAIIICGIIIISLGILLPKLLMPVYEKNIYEYLKQPLYLMHTDFDQTEFKEIAYLYVVDDKKIMVSENLTDIITLTPEQIINYINEDYGKFTYLGKTYYYYTNSSNHIMKISLTNDNYIIEIRQNVLKTLIPIIAGTLFLTIGLIILWSRKLVLKIEHLKEKIDNIANDDYVDNQNYKIEDELYTLSNAIDEMKDTLKRQDEYKNQMYQNISHDFKTPLTVIKSHIEAIDDKVIDYDKGITIIKEQVSKLESKVHSLLYLNKLTYIKNLDNYQNEKTDISIIINESIEKFKIQRSDLEFKIKMDKNTIFNGTYDMWEAIIDNILNNFMRYALKEIRITIKNNKITFYNDGPNIDENILDDIFTPYKKGINGCFGLGLSIVKNTISLLGYEIKVHNEKKGVSFDIN